MFGHRLGIRCAAAFGGYFGYCWRYRHRILEYLEYQCFRSRSGLAAIVLESITSLGAFELFLCAGLIAGAIQLALGFLRVGSIAEYIPLAVIEGMLAGIGVIIIINQLPLVVRQRFEAARRRSGRVRRPSSRVDSGDGCVPHHPDFLG